MKNKKLGHPGAFARFSGCAPAVVGGGGASSPKGAFSRDTTVDR